MIFFNYSWVYLSRWP